MRVEVALVDGADPLEAGQLYGWLASDAAVSSASRVRVSTHDGGGTMGALEVIDVTLTHISGLAALLLAVDSWRKSRRSAPAVRYRLGGLEIVADNDSPETLAAAERALRAAWESAAGEDDGVS